MARHPLRQRVHRGEHGQRGEAVGVPCSRLGLGVGLGLGSGSGLGVGAGAGAGAGVGAGAGAGAGPMVLKQNCPPVAPSRA